MPSEPGLPRALHIVGRKNHGKTTLVLELVEALRGRGLAVGTVKHTGHVHELDTPGKDSHRHRLAGAAPVAVVSAELTAIYLPDLDPARPYARLAPLFAGCDLVLVEGHLDGPGPRVEVWRRAGGTAPLASSRPDIAAVVSDDAPALSAAVPIWPRRDLDALIRQLTAAGLVPPPPPGSTPGDDTRHPREGSP
jgi:molybdopterin-guanine dinucleotide biosynthesis protein B